MQNKMWQLEQTIDGKWGQFQCESETPYHVVKEMLFQFAKHIGQMEDQVKAALVQQAAEKAALEQVVEIIEEPKPE